MDAKSLSKHETKRIPQLEGLRFIMCCIIILSHFEFLGESEVFGDFYKAYLHNPTLAVDYFFMLSGFGIYLSSKRPERTIKGAYKFAVDKVKKIYPAYLFSLFLGSAWIVLITDGVINAIAKIIVFGVIDLTLLQSITGMTMFSHSINGVCWFLSTLFICYIICPCLLHCVDKIKNRKQAWSLIIGFVFVALALSFVALLIENYLSFFTDLWYGHPFIRCWYLAIGMCVGYLYKESSAEMGCRKEVLISILALAYFFCRNSMPFGEEVLRAFDIFLCTFFLYVFSCGNGRISKALGYDCMVNLGNASMYLFLFHYPIRMILRTIFSNNGFNSETGVLLLPSLIILSTCLVTYLFREIEGRLGNQIKNFGMNYKQN